MIDILEFLGETLIKLYTFVEKLELEHFAKHDTSGALLDGRSQDRTWWWDGILTIWNA